MVIEWTISISTIIQTIVILGGGLIVLGEMRRTLVDVELEMKNMKEDLKEIGKAVMQIAVQNQRLDRVEEDIRDLRKGRGFILPNPTAQP